MNKRTSLKHMILLVLLASGCKAFTGNNWDINTTVIKKKELSATLASVNVANNQIKITGSGFSGVTIAKIQGNGINADLSVNSQSDTQMILTAKSALSLLMNGTFNLIIGNAEAQVSYPITFTLQNGAVQSINLAQMGATNGQVLKWNGSAWMPASLASSQVYLGNWNATNFTPDITTLGLFQSGDYFIVNVAGTYTSSVLVTSPTTFAVGDWVMFNGSKWEKIDNTSNAVSSFQGRSGAVTLQPSDYVSLKNSTTHKITGSSINDLADIDLTTLTPTNGQLIKYNSSTNKWEPGDDLTSGGTGSIGATEIASGSITNTHISATAAIAQSKINNLTTDLAAKEGTITAGVVTQYYRGDKTFQTLNTTIVPEGTNLYHTDARTLSTPITTPTLTNSAIAAGDTIQTSLGKMQAQISSKESSVGTGTSDEYYRGDKTFVNFATDVRGSTLTGLSSTAGNIGSTDTLLGAFGKLLNTQTDSLSKSDSTAANTISGQVTVNSIGALKLTYTPTNATDAVNKSYVDSVGPWSVSSGNVYRASGNVGIGTTSPGAKLDVQASTSGSTTASQVSIGNSSSNKFSILNYDSDYNGFGMSTHFDGTNWIADAVTSSFIYKGNGYLNIFGNSGLTTGSSYSPTSRMSIALATGNVGIGTTSPSSTLEINSPVATFGNNQFKVTDGTTGGYFSVSEGGSGASVYLPTFTFASTGLSGWGGSLLGVVPAAQDTFVAAAAAISVDGRQNNAALINANIFNVRNFGTPLMTVKANGNVGVGTTSPAQKLSVVGTIQSTTGGFMFPDGTTMTTANVASSQIADASLPIIKLSGARDATKYLKGDNTWSTLATDVIASVLSGFALDTNAKPTVTTTDTVASGFGKVQKYLNDINSDYVSKSSSNQTITGTLNFTSPVAFLYSNTPTGTTATEVANVQYVTSAISANGIWNKSGSDINYTAGKVGIGTSTPLYPLHVYDSSGNNTFEVRPASGTYQNGTYILAGGSGGAAGVGSANSLFNVAGGTTINLARPGGAVTASFNVSDSYVNKLNVSGSSAGNAVQITTSGTDTNINLALMPKGSGSIGVGTTSPNAKMHINDSGANGNYFKATNSISTTGFDVGVNSSGSGVLYQRDNSSIVIGTNNLERVRIDNAGNVGIGTSTPSTRLSVLGTTSDSTTASMNIANSSGGSLLYVRNDGNVGIGTTAPAQMLDVNGNARISGTLFITNMSRGSSNQLLNIFADITAGNGAQIDLYGSTNATTPGIMTFKTAAGASSERMRIDAIGNIGIGTTSPSNKLSVTENTSRTTFTGTNAGTALLANNAGTTNFTTLDFGNINSSAGVPESRIGSVRTTLGSLLYFGTSNNYSSGITNSAMVIDSTGNVGIGSTAPGSRLAVNSTSTGTISATITAANADTTFSTSSALTLNAGDYIVPTTASQARVVTAGGTASSFTVTPAFSSSLSAENFSVYRPALNINSGKLLVQGSTGYVGIGTSAPTQLLTVSGSTASNIYGLWTNGTQQILAGISSGNLPIIGTISSDPLLIFAGNSERMRITSTGNVGIGTSTPSNTLDIQATSGDSVLSVGTGSIAGNHRVNVRGGGASNQYGYYLGSHPVLTTNTATSSILYIGSEGTNTQIQTQTFHTNAGERMRITSSGNVGIGTTSPGYKLQVGVAADGSEARANAWNVLSDERLKRDFEIIPDSLEKLLTLNGYYYHWNRGIDNSKKMGLKAQEVEKVFPEVVSKGSDGFLSVSYNHLVAAVIESIKSFFHFWKDDSAKLHQEIKSLKTQVITLEKNNKDLEARILKIEKNTEELNYEK